ncbi:MULTISPECIES: PaaI family thioesterase [Achromobacter]|uniref:PaaI family thioesterase n=1 Tax=Achromobacter spanius TaxID=217203 RepID=A0ABY8GMH7_9BURK|nr:MULTISPECIES: PaaI family thioesterase [Achromobacter]WAI84877.1 PaaI family thioesterase [Achromobacter spanius]WEX94960.1 PaaI family thioesterase [Achromobacter sp. SS2-2022]WFP05872.1 PaaI family thioesterase [Achromobacter spanius]
MPPPVTAESLAAEGWHCKTLPGFAGLIGPLWVRKEGVFNEGVRKEAQAWAYGLLATADHLNPAGVVHGGLLTALLDHGLSAIAWQALDRRACVTVQLDTHFLAPARAGQFLEVRGQLLRATSSLVFMRGELSVAGNIVATGAAVLKVLAAASDH